jgi:RNA polymerase sigma-70 factor (ECF subfamily)
MAPPVQAPMPPTEEMPIRPLPDVPPATEPHYATDTEQAFWRLWLTHQDQLRRQCLHMMAGNLADAEDALSAAMLRASQKFQDYAGSIMNEKAWLSKLVHNVCIDQYRQRKRTYYQAFEPEDTQQVEDAMFTGPQPSPEEVALGKEQIVALEACLAQLSNNLRVPLMLRCVEGWSYPDIAAELDLRADTVRKRVQLARDFLRQRDIR